MIGDVLRKEREAQKLSIQDVEKETSIRAIYIEAIEQGDYDKLPGEVYAKGFIKNYGNFLNLDGDELVKQFIIEISPMITMSDGGENADEIAKNSPSENKSKIATPQNISRRKNRAESNDENTDDAPEENSNSRKYILVAVVLIAVIFGGLLISFNGDKETEIADNQQPQQQEIQQPQPEIPQIAQVTNSEPQPVPPPPPPTNSVNLQATFSDDCWTRVIADGAVVFEGMINAGQVFDWKGEQSVYVLLGNAGAVNFVMNGENIGTLGADGAVVKRTFVR